MRGLAWGLLLANVLVAAYFFGHDYWPQTASDKAVPLNVERLSLRSQSASPQPAAAAPAETALCVEWRGLTAEERAVVREQLKAMVTRQPMSFAETPIEMLRWVIFPPLPSAQSAAAKLAELVAAGIQGGEVVQAGEWQHALSLGEFDTDEAARLRVRELEDKGVLGTRIELVPKSGTEFYFVIRSEDPDMLKGLDALKQPYPNSRQSRVACRPS
ncbi:MAG: hypothetical protein AB1418_10985 [Pseudomonadota bacterium]